IIAEIESELNKVDSQLQTLGRHLGTRHPKIVSLTTVKRNVQQRLTAAQQSNKNRFAGGFYDPQIAQWMVNLVTNELNQAIQHEHLISQEYDLAKKAALDLNDQLAEVQMATRDLESLQRRHTYLLNQLNDIDIGQVNSSFRVTHLNRPLLPTSPVSPVLAQMLAISCLLGSICAFGTIFVIDLIDDRLRTPDDVQNQLALPILGVIRPLPEDELDDHRIYVHGHPLSVQTECFRTIRTAISLSGSDSRCIAITSSEQSEGKTTLTSNLAATFAQTGSRTLLIDADMRRPGLSKMLDIRGNGGLSEILRANEDVPEMCRERIVATEVDGLDVLPCGPRMMNAGVLLSMPSLAAILDWAVSEYDQVMVDCPPTLPVSDAAIVGNYVDGIVFLLNPEQTHRRSALRAVEQLRSVGMNLLGVVTNTSSEAHDGAYGYGYGYGQEYSYGHDESELDEEETYTSVKFDNTTKASPRYSLLSDSSDDDDSRRAA
ncbi:MAG: polysaccharide biosynthesis tyrosine autokinase, partial [Phycisphaerales bacterium]|nr:polysaccharide biosynthesis tyrosine autokinase [Phycisphaerales bacterium]